MSLLLIILGSLPANSAYVSGEIQEMVNQLESERRLMGDATFKSLMEEMWLIPANRQRTVISIILMVCQQLTGVNAIVRYAISLLLATISI